jgi:hypothetical protein
MPLPQVSDRIKELPGQALRAVFTGVGQLLLAAEKVRAQLATPAEDAAQSPAAASPETAAPPAAAPPAAAPPAAAAPAAAAPAAAAPGRAAPAGSSVTPPEVTDPAESRWRSLDKTGNVRLLHDGDPDLSTAADAAPAPAEAEPAVPTPAEVAEPAPAEAAEVAPAEAAPAEAVPAEPAAAKVAEPAPAEPVPAEPTLAAEPAAAEVTPTAEPAAVAEADLPVAGYDQLSVASLRARLRVLDVAQVRTLLDYEKAHQDRADMVTMFERRIAKLEQGG